MLNKQVAGLGSKPELKDRRFVRSRSKSQSNLPESPRNHFPSSTNNVFCPKFIAKKTSFKENDKENRLNQSLREECSNKLPEKLKVIQLEDQLKRSQKERQSLKMEVKKLKQKCGQLEEKKGKQNSSVNKSKVSPLKEIKGNQNLKKLKKQIADSKQPQTCSDLEYLQEQNKGLVTDNGRLKIGFMELEKTVKELKKKSIEASQKEQQLQQVVERLKIQTKHQEEQNRRLDMRLKVYLAKQANFEVNKQSSEKQELQSLKFRFTKLIIQHNELKKQISKTKPTPQPTFAKKNKIINEHKMQSYEVSLSLSPDEREVKY